MMVLEIPFMFLTSHPFQILLSVIIYMVLGMIWFGPLFGKPWASMSGMNKVSKANMKKAMAPAMATSVIGAVIQASILGVAFMAATVGSFVEALGVVLLLWFGFTTTVIATNHAYTMKPVKLLLIDALFPLVTWIAMAAVLYFW